MPIIEQSYSDHGWMDNPNLIWSISGIGGDGSQWKEITEAEANQFIADLQSKPDQKRFNVANLDKLTQEERHKVIGNIVARANKAFCVTPKK